MAPSELNFGEEESRRSSERMSGDGSGGWRQQPRQTLLLQLQLQLLTFLVGIVYISSRYCHLDDFAQGQWVLHESISRKSFTCCSWDGEDFRNRDISAQCGSYDPPTKHEFQYGQTNVHVQTGGHGCSCDALQNHRHTVSHREKWRWQPEGCEVFRWNATQFCELLGSKKILFVGDSTMVQSAVTVMNMIVADTPKGLCGHQLLSLAITTPEQVVDNIENSQRMIKTFKEFSPDYFVVNFGPHFHDEKSFVDSMTNFASLLTQLRNESGKPVHAIWKTINSPHFECEKYHDAVKVAPARSAKDKDPFQWDLMPGFDKFATSLFPQYGVKVMDMSMLKLRPDAHPGRIGRVYDCLHFCMPGPLDVVSVMLLHVLYHHRHHSEAALEQLTALPSSLPTAVPSVAPS